MKDDLRTGIIVKFVKIVHVIVFGKIFADTVEPTESILTLSLIDMSRVYQTMAIIVGFQQLAGLYHLVNDFLGFKLGIFLAWLVD